MVNTEELSKIMRESNYDIYAMKSLLQADVNPVGTILEALKAFYEAGDCHSFGLHVPLVLQP